MKAVVQRGPAGPGMAAVDDAALVRLAASGRDEAWEELVRRKQSLVCSVARNRGLSEADVADVAQTTWLILLSNIRSLRQAESINGWLATTARREAVRVSRRRRRSVEMEVQSFAPQAVVRSDELGHPEAVALAGERRAVLRQAVSALPGHQRRIVELQLTQPHLQYRQVAAEAGMAIGSIGPTRRRAFDQLSACEAVLALR